jgi:translation initiation factor IF-3
VRVIGAEGEQLGILDTREARSIAESQGLDLVQVAANSDPPVCKILDYGKFKYEEKKKQKAAKKKQVHIEIKEIQLRPKTDIHDLDHKAKSALKFLEDGDKVKVTVFYRGRELQHIQGGWDTLNEFTVRLMDKAVIEVMPKMEGRRLSCQFTPLPPNKKLPNGHLIASMPKTGPGANRGGTMGQGASAPSMASVAAAAAASNAAASTPPVTATPTATATTGKPTE